MAISVLQSYSSNYGESFTNNLDIASVTASSGDYIVAAYSFRVGFPSIGAAPVWNGQTFTLLHTSSDQSKTVFVYGLLSSSSTTATITASCDWTFAASLIRVFTGGIASSGTIFSLVSGLEDNTSSPWVAPSLTVSGLASGDIAVGILFAADQNTGAVDLSGLVFTPGASQSSTYVINNSVSHYIGSVASSTKSTTGSTSVSFTINDEPIYTYVAFGIKAAASISIDDINSGGVIRVGSTGNTITTTGLATLTSLTIGSVSATSLSATGGDGTFSMPAFVDGGTYQLLGTKTVTAGDGTNTANISKSLDAPTSHSYVTLSGTLNTTNTGVLYNFSPAAVVGDQIVYITANGTVDAQGNYEGDFDGTQTMWHIKASDGVTRSYDVITGVVGLTVNLTGVSTIANVGTITPSLGSGADINVSLTGVGSTASVGIIVATITEYIVNTVSEDLPKFLKDAVKAFRKPFSKSFRKK